MATSRIAILALLMSLSLRAETKLKLAVKVTDKGGAPVSHATVRSGNSASPIKAEAFTDAQGEAVLFLEPGIYSVTVSAQGFQSWKSTMVRVALDASRLLKAELRPGETGSGYTVFEEKRLLIEHPNLVEFIAPEEFESVAVLPARKVRHPAWVHPRKYQTQ